MGVFLVFVTTSIGQQHQEIIRLNGELEKTKDAIFMHDETVGRFGSKKNCSLLCSSGDMKSGSGMKVSAVGLL